MLPHVGVRQFVLYDDGSDDDTLDRLRPYVRDGMVQVLTTNELRPWKNETMLKAHACRGWHTTFPNWERRHRTTVGACEASRSRSRSSMIRDATLRATTEFIAFIDADEFLIHAIPSPFAKWLATLDADVGGVIGMGKIMMSSKNASPLLTETKQMDLQDEFLRQKCVVRRSAVSDVSVGIVHEIALKNGMRYVRDPTVAMLHFRYRGFDRRTQKRYLVSGEAPEFGRKAKLAKLDRVAKKIWIAERRRPYLHCTAGLPHAHRAMQNVWLRTGDTVRAAHPGAGGGGGALGEQLVCAVRLRITLRRDVPLYRAVSLGSRSTGAGRHFDDECVHVIKTLLDCSLPLAQWKEMKADQKAVELQHAGGIRDVPSVCAHVHGAARGGEDHSRLRPVFFGQRGDGGRAHRAGRGRRPGVQKGATRRGLRTACWSEAKRKGANLTVKLADATRRDGVARFVTARIGWPWTEKRAKCARPLDRSWDACGPLEWPP